MTEIELSYCAGLFDGEGCFSVCKTKHSYNLTASITLTSLELLEEFQIIIKLGTIKKHSVSGNRKQAYKWRACSTDAAKVAKLLLPYLKLKNVQAQKLIEFDSVWIRYEGTELDYQSFLILEMICQEMSILNMRGK